METELQEITDRIRNLPEIEKSVLVDRILEQLDKPDPEIDRIWADEARKRWDVYKNGRVKTVAYEDVMARYQRK